jgi:hypothetical protein
MLLSDVGLMPPYSRNGVDLFRSRVALEAESLVLRQKIIVLRRTTPKKLRFSSIDKQMLAGICRLFPKVCDALSIVGPGYGCPLAPCRI